MFLKYFLLFCLCVHIKLLAATLSVLPGESIQSQIDASSAGDIIAIFGGTYSEDITINKAIRLVEVSGQDVILLGGVTFDGVTDAPPFEGFTVGSSGKRITIRDTTGLLLRDIDQYSAGATVVISGTSDNTKIVECTLSNFDPEAGVTELVDSTVNGKIFQYGGSLHTTNVTVGSTFNTDDSAVRTIAFRTTVSDGCYWESNRAWFGYSTARYFKFGGSNAKVVVVGSEIDRVKDEQQDGIQLHGLNNYFLVTNSVVKNVWSSGADTNCVEVSGLGNSARILNNYLQQSHNTQWGDSGGHSNLRVVGTADVLFANNICSNNVEGLVDAPFGVTVPNNHAIQGKTIVKGGGVATDTTIGNPLFVDGDPYQLGEGSPCIDAGTEDPRYNDRDGSRNDIGPSGGAWYDPDGWTTENPVVIAFELSVDQILEGEATPILLQEGLGVSIP